MSSKSFKSKVTNKLFPNESYIYIYIYMNKQDLALNNHQELMGH